MPTEWVQDRRSVSTGVDGAAFRGAMTRFAAAVSVVTTDGTAGRRGVTVSSACSVSDDPAILLVCINSQSIMNQRFLQNGVFAVNVLAADQEAVARAFAGEGNLGLDERFAQAAWSTLETGSPILEGALASFDCRLREHHTVATHHVLYGEVVGLQAERPGHSLLYLDRSYRTL
ncbi:flavin reductase family protein [Consotaella aegiceratis]|uniref:flavin reductase family protein n=1 Tax=Consotaella aegiceratis TaxID=3097961 RepID=UPI002F428F46